MKDQTLHCFGMEMTFHVFLYLKIGLHHDKLQLLLELNTVRKWTVSLMAIY